jgi:hypothetical protein
VGIAKIPTKQLGAFKSTILQSVAVDSSVSVGSFVRMDTTSNTFVNAQADTPDNARVVGICIFKASSTVGDIVLPGSLTDPIFTGLVKGVDYFLSETVPGSLTLTIPTGVGAVIMPLGRAYNAGQLFFLPMNMIRRGL